MTSLVLLVSFALGGIVHDGPDPVLFYPLVEQDLVDGTLKSRFGPDVQGVSGLGFAPIEKGGGCTFDASSDVLIARSHATLGTALPVESMTVSAWVAVDEPQSWGGVMSCLVDNASLEKGWVLGYDQNHFYFGLSTVGADDGDGLMTYLKGTTRYDCGRMYHVVGTYDGDQAVLYVNGREEARTSFQSGPILYPDSTVVSLGAYRDSNEFNRHVGRLSDVRVYDLAADASWILGQFKDNESRAGLPAHLGTPAPISDEIDWLVPPVLQFPTEASMGLIFETTRPVTGAVHFGADSEFGRQVTISEPAMLVEVLMDGLNAGSSYFYQVDLVDDMGRPLVSDVLSFQTAASRGVPVTFALLSDTQDNPEVCSTLATHIWDQRPGFIIHPGDLTGTGSLKGDWTEEFFPGMNGLLSRVAMYPVLGNHEQDARHYYRYFSLPEPEYFYRFSQGDADFFMIDTNRTVAPGSEQYSWLDSALADSNARWKFVVHHHPPYSSDENDYGDTWRGQGRRGDLRIRPLTQLYDRHGVDLVLNGHIHSYERTWPISGGRVVDDGGVIYTITGGGGGGLEAPGPTRPDFNNTLRTGHHYCMIRINGRTLEFFAYDLQNRLFDHMSIRKSD
ncbi:MAG: metallophosphoesterase [Phycisphaerae bacterium]|nr:metallophosphoesterase [Phycisphaerae bacterium]HAW96436.1 metallophosphoesterase [Phycisphaerales bacterium]